MRSVNLLELKDHIKLCVLANEIPFVAGSPGLGKSAIFAALAKELNLEFIDFRLSMCDQSDLLGFPRILEGKSAYAPPAIFPLEGDELPEGKDGWLISMEEINSAPKSIQAIAYKLLHDRMVGNFKLHPKVRFVANGNLETDGAVVMPMSSALASRMIQYIAEIEPKSWLQWAMGSGKFHPMVLGYLGYKPSNVHRFDPTSSDKAFPNPRCWEKVSKLLNLEPNIDKIRVSIEGAVGEGTTQDMVAFTKFFHEVPKMQDVLKDVHTFPLSDRGINYATLLTFVDSSTEDQFLDLLPFFDRMGVESAVMALRIRIQTKGHGNLKTDPRFMAAVSKYASLIR